MATERLVFVRVLIVATFMTKIITNMSLSVSEWHMALEPLVFVIAFFKKSRLAQLLSNLSKHEYAYAFGWLDASAKIILPGLCKPELSYH